MLFLLRAALLLLIVNELLLPARAAEELPVDKLEIQAKIPHSGDFMGFGFDSLWMMSGAKMLRVNAKDNSEVLIKVPGAGGNYRGIAIGKDAIWVPDTASKTIYKLDPGSNSVTAKIPCDFYDSEGSIGVGYGSIWIVATGEKFQAILSRYNSVSGVLEATIPLERGSISAWADYGSIWVTNNEKGRLYRIDPQKNSIADDIALHERPRFLTSAEGSIWVLNQSDGTVQRIDGKTGKLLATIETEPGGRGGGDIAGGGGYVWVTLKGNYPVIQIDPRTNSVKRAFKGIGFGDAIRYGANSLWVSGSHIFRIKAPD